MKHLMGYGIVAEQARQDIRGSCFSKCTYRLYPSREEAEEVVTMLPSGAFRVHPIFVNLEEE